MNTARLLATATAVIAVSSAGGCSNQSLYSNLQADARKDCEKYLGDAYTRCLEEANTSYNEYRNQRKQALEQPTTAEN